MAASGSSIRELIEQVRRSIPRLDARLLIQHLLGISHAQFLAHPERTLSAEEVERFMQLVRRRERGEPVAYLTGEKDFYGRLFRVTPDVLVPRPETELIVTLTLAHAAALTWPRIIDLGTGSGAIAVSLGCELPEASVFALDVSCAALGVASENSRRHGAGVRFIASDWLSALNQQARFEIIVSNPPYVAAHDPHLSQGGLPFEPNIALSDGADGLGAIRRIIAEAGNHLADDGLLLIEHGYDQAAAVRALLAAGPYRSVESWRDLAGIERVSGARRIIRDAATC